MILVKAMAVLELPSMLYCKLPAIPAEVCIMDCVEQVSTLAEGFFAPDSAELQQMNSKYKAVPLTIFCWAQAASKLCSLWKLAGPLIETLRRWLVRCGVHVKLRLIMIQLRLIMS